MFAILFSKEMDGFYSIVLAFPTIIFSVLIIVSVIYWLVTFLGAVDFDVLDADIGDGVSNNGVAGLAMKLGLRGVPLPIIVTLIAIVGWLVSYYGIYFAKLYVPAPVFLLAQAGVFVLSVFLSIRLTGLVIRPLKKFFRVADQQVEKTIIGQVAIVRTGRVDQKFGEATVEDGGAGLVVKVRPYKDQDFQRGDRVILLEYIEEQGIYKIIPESEFIN